MEFDKKLLIHEIKRLLADARIQARGQRPQLALIRIATSLQSLATSLEDEAQNNTPLTPRESQILHHVSQGYTNKETAAALSLSEKTIEFHLKSVFGKTEASTRTEAVKNAMNSGWLA